MRSDKGTIGRALDQPDRAIRLYLFHGADESQSRGHGERLLAALGAERFAVAAGAIKGDPALLADEAGAMSLFGGPRAIWIDPAGDEITPGVEALLAAGAAESPVIVIAGALRKTSTLLKLCEASPQAFAHVSYALEGKNAERMVGDLARTYGLRIEPTVAARIADACGNDRAIAVQELAKLALFLDASPETPREADHDALDAIGAETSEGGFLRLADQALSGRLGELADGLFQLSSGSEAVPAIRSLQRRIMLLAPIRARVEAGESPSAVMTSVEKSLFWKDKSLVAQLLERWDAAALVRVAERAGQLERDLMRELVREGTKVPESAALGEELIAIGRAAQRAR